jgi:hypothetical protein
MIGAVQRQLPPLIVALLGAAVAAAAASCGPRTEVVLGLATDLVAGPQLDEVVLTVNSGGVTVPQDWTFTGAANDPVRLPASFALYSDGGHEPQVRLDLAARWNGHDLFHREETLTLAADQTLFARLALVGACGAIACPDDQTCVESRCVDKRVGPLPAYVSGLENALACASGPTYRNTAGNAPLPVGGRCPDGQYCSEGTCYPAPRVRAFGWGPAWTLDLGAIVGPIAAADLNGDGRTDLVTVAVTQDAFCSSGTASACFARTMVIPGAAGGTWGAPIVAPTSTTGGGPIAIEIIDLDGHGATAVLTGFSSEIDVRRSNGDGTLGPSLPVASASSNDYAHVLSADFNGDRRADLAVASVVPNEVDVSRPSPPT